MKMLIPTRIAGLLILVLCLTPAHAEEINQVHGESLVLVGTEPARLWFPKIRPKSVSVRSTYEPDEDTTIQYELGKDYTLDATAGTLTRTPDSRIPDFSTNVLYGQQDFDHSKFPGFGNTAFFVFVDYKTKAGTALCAPSDQAAFLPKTRAKLTKGGPFKLLVFGDSISAGGDATKVSHRFQQRYAKHLAEQFPKAEITVENGATGGDSTHTGLQRIEDKVLTRSPDLVLVGFGMNDHNINGVAPDKFTELLTTIINQIRERTDAEIILLSTFPPNPDWKHSSHRMDVYAAATQQVADEQSTAYADVYTAWMSVLERKDRHSMLGNNINHPNDFGHWIYAEVLKSIRF